MAFDLGVCSAVVFAQLAGVVLDGVEPAIEAAAEALLRGRAGGGDRGLDRVVVAHDVALDRAAQAADVLRPARAAADDGEADFLAALSGEVGLGRHAREEAVGVPVAQVRKGLAVLYRRPLEAEAIVAGADRTFVAVERDLEV